ncbi:hypothetical protein IAE20_07075 [Acinetobacter sp. S54]|nr:hypothetical protein [Acinetobacter sp. S55]MBK0066666.1 hypothetical protein [Acinetobacter sp. S54]
MHQPDYGGCINVSSHPVSLFFNNNDDAKVEKYADKNQSAYKNGVIR